MNTEPQREGNKDWKTWQILAVNLDKKNGNPRGAQNLQSPMTDGK